MIEYTWNIESLECVPTFGEFNNVVKNVHWRCIAEDGNDNAQIYGSSSLGISVDQETFIPYENLTKEKVLEWIWNNGVNKEREEAVLASIIYVKKNPPTINVALPW